MLALIAAAFGFWANQHAGFFRSEVGTLNFEVDARALGGDLRWLWSALVAVCAFTVSAGRNARRFARTIRPWFALVGLTLPELPSFPALPTQDRLTA